MANENIPIEERLCNLVFKKKWYSEKENGILKKKIKDPSVIKNLSVRTEDNRDTKYISEFLESKNKKEIHYYEEMWKKICPCHHMNPHVKRDLYSEYFVDNINGVKLSHIVQFNELLEYDKNNELEIKRYRDKVIFHIGTKGSGKTLWQNIWLYNNNNKFEENNILWIRLDVEKLYKIWDRLCIGRISTKDYILGQMLYVICKHYKGEAKSPLIEKIINEFSKNTKNKIQGVILTKSNLEDSGDDDDVLFNYCYVKKEKVDDNSIIALLKYFEEEIAKYENLKIENDDRRLISGDRDKSFFIDKVVLDKPDSKLFKVWMIVARKIYDFILENDYFILTLIDGIDNFIFHLHQQRLKKEIFKQVCDNHLETKNQNVITIISLRDYMYSHLKQYSIKNGYVQFRDGRYLDHAIYQQENNLGKHIYAKRVDYIKKHIDSNNCIIAKVLDELKNDHAVDDTKWNANYRSFLSNHFSLAKYIAFKHYWRPKHSEVDFEKEIKRYEDINFLLNGELFVSESEFEQNEDFGVNCFNLFDVPDKNCNIDIFTYIRLLLIIRNKDEISYNEIIDVFKIFNINETISKSCIERLVDTSLVHQSFPGELEGTFLYSISNKGNFALDKCFNDIHFLYYLSLDTYLPSSLLEHIKVAFNNIGKNEKRKYPITCIISGLTFLNYLYFKNQSDLRKIKDKNLSLYDMKKSVFALPINRDSLKESVSKMVKIINDGDKTYSQEFYDWIKLLNK